MQKTVLSAGEMQDRMAYEYRLDRRREKANYDQIELEGLRNNQKRAFSSCCATIL